MHRDLSLAKIGCSKLNLIDALTRACLPSSPVSFPSLETRRRRHCPGDRGGRNAMLFFFFFSFTGRLTLLYYRFIKAFAASISLEIYKSFTCLFIFICVRLVPATFKQRRSRRFYWRRQDHIMARRQMHSLNIQKMAQRTEMTNNCFSLQPLCVQGHGILEPWVLAAPWNLLLSFLSLCSSSIFPLWSNGFLGNLTKHTLFFIVYINVCF